MDLWIVSPDPNAALPSVRKLSSQQAQDAQNGKLFIARASSPVFAKSLAESIRHIAADLPRMDAAQLEREHLARRTLKVGRNNEVPVYEALLSWPPVD